jgi:hypothetical protein
MIGITKLIPGFSWLKLAVGGVAFFLVAGAFWKVYLTIYQRGVADTTATYTARDLQAFRKAEKVTAALQAAADDLTKERDAKTEANRIRITALTNSLRKRPERPASNIGSTLPTANCTGAELSQTDGRFLVWYASEATRISDALATCEAQYDKVRRQSLMCGNQ